MLKAIIDEYAATLEKKWSHDRSKTVGASEIGQCARKTLWTKQGKKPDDDWTETYGARVRGTIIEENFWYPALAARYGDALIHAGPKQKTLVKGYLSATPDALILNQPPDALKMLGIPDIKGTCFMAECKTIDPRANIIEAKTENLFQVHVQLGLTRELTDHQPVYNVLTYTDASFLSEVIEFPVEFDPKIYRAAEDRATVIMTAKHGAELPPEGWIAGGKECSFCPFVKPCGVERRSVPRENKKATPQFVAEITDYAREINSLKQQIMTAEKKQREMEQTLKDRMREKGVRRIEGVVNWYKVSGSVHYKGAAMKQRLIELGEDVDEFASEGEETDRLVIAAIPAVIPGTFVPGTLKKRKIKRANTKARTTNGKSKHNRKTAGRKHATARAGSAHGKRTARAGAAARKGTGRRRSRR